MKLPRWLIVTPAVAGLVLAGCASNDPNPNVPRPRNGIAEYQQIASEARRSMEKALDALKQVSTHTVPLPPRAVKTYSDAAERLEVESLRVRARSQAMQARGKAYFENWQENLERIKDARVRSLAQQHRAELEQDFDKIRQTSQETREAFEPFLSGLRQLRTALEKDPKAMAADSTRALVNSTTEKGREVEKGLAAIRNELDEMARLLTPAKSGTK
jgi:DNA repair exonuclease SbcCD ATPase subunit